MGFDNCETNVWAVALKDTVLKKFSDSLINLTESGRSQALGHNLERIEQVLKIICSNEKRKSICKHLCVAIMTITKESESIHIESAKDLLIRALNRKLNSDELNWEADQSDQQ